MTCIVALAHDGVVTMGGDSAAVDSSLGLQIRLDRKVFRKGAYTMGFTTSFRMGQILHHVVRLPTPPVEGDLNAFMCSRFIPAVIKSFDDHGFGGSDQEGKHGGEFLVAVRGQLFNIMSDYQVSHVSDGYAAVGGGAELALGSLYTTRAWRDPRRRLHVALEAAAQFNAGVRPPFYFIGPDDAA